LVNLGKKVKTEEVRNCQFCDEIEPIMSMQVRTEFGETGLACALCVQAIDEMSVEGSYYGNWWDSEIDTTPLVTSSTKFTPLPQCLHNCKPLKLPTDLLVEDNGVIYLSAHKGMNSTLEGKLPTVGVYLYDGWLPTNSIWTNDGTVVRQMEGEEADGDRGLEIRKMYVEWGDMRGIPGSTLAIVLKYIHEAIVGGEDVEIACLGGHGRTGTLAAAVCMMYGMGAKESIEYVRNTYCNDAIESVEQVDMLFDLYTKMYPTREAEEGRDMIKPVKVLSGVPWTGGLNNEVVVSSPIGVKVEEKGGQKNGK
jgi:hypothetical protein